LPSVEISTVTTSAPSLPIKGVWPTIRSYILWQHERGTLHYDIMVTLILIFIFFSPRVINFNDKPESLTRHPTGVVVNSDSDGGLVYQIEASSVTGGDEPAVRDQLLRVIEPISGNVSILRYEPVFDSKGRVKEYRVWVKRK
jgi:hypothetical protein